MAVTTTTTQTDRILAEIIAARALEASYPKLVLQKLINYDPDMLGQPATAKSYPRLSDIGAAGTASEGSEISTVTTAAMGTQLTLTPTEAAAIRFDLTDQVARKRAPGIVEVASAIDQLDVGRLLQIFGEDIMRQRKACYEKLEVDCWALVDDFTTSVGVSGSDFTLAQAEAAMLSLTDKETGREEDWMWAWAPVMRSDLVKEIAITGGGAGGAVWSTDIQSIVTMKPDLGGLNIQGALYGIPAVVGSTSVNPSPNGGDDEAGALFVAGFGHPEGPRPGAFAMLDGQRMHTRFEGSIADRETKIVTIWEYAVGERADDMGVSIITDA